MKGSKAGYSQEQLVVYQVFTLRVVIISSAELVSVGFVSQIVKKMVYLSQNNFIFNYK